MSTKILDVSPGNGSRYLIVYGTTDEGEPFVALPGFHTAAICTPYPVEHTYLAQKLRISEPDALAVFDAIRDDAGA